MSSGITAQLATIPGRDPLPTVKSLIPQVDLVRVALNNYKEIPTSLNLRKVEPFLRNNEKGDAEKFYECYKQKGYFFTCDDDLIYPPDYVERMMRGFDDYGDNIYTFHGRDYPPKPIRSYYGDRIRAYRCLCDVEEDVYVDVGGSGVMAWHTDYFSVDYDRITTKNMADIWVSLFASEKNLKIICLSHKEGWIKYLHPVITIWDTDHLNDLVQTDLYNSF